MPVELLVEHVHLLGEEDFAIINSLASKYK